MITPLAELDLLSRVELKFLAYAISPLLLAIIAGALAQRRWNRRKKLRRKDG